MASGLRYIPKKAPQRILYRMMTRRGITCEALAKKGTMSKTWLSIVMQSKANLTVEAANKFCDAMGADKKERQKLYDAIAKERKRVPYDIEQLFTDNSGTDLAVIKNVMRLCIEYDYVKDDWLKLQDFIMTEHGRDIDRRWSRHESF